MTDQSKLETRIRRQVTHGSHRAHACHAESLLTVDEWRSVLLASEGRCHYCGKYIGIDKLVLEHIVSLGHGGHHILGNVVPACQGCNVKKSHRPDEHPPAFRVIVPTTGWKKDQWHVGHWSIIFDHLIERGHELELYLLYGSQFSFVHAFTYVRRLPGYWMRGRAVHRQEIIFIWPERIEE